MEFLYLSFFYFTLDSIRRSRTPKMIPLSKKKKNQDKEGKGHSILTGWQGRYKMAELILLRFTIEENLQTSSVN